MVCLNICNFSFSHIFSKDLRRVGDSCTVFRKVCCINGLIIFLHIKNSVPYGRKVRIKVRKSISERVEAKMRKLGR
jgi:hypothetical protein